MCGGDHYEHEFGDELLCNAMVPQCAQPRATYLGEPCQVPGCFHGQARRLCNGLFCRGHCRQLEIIRDALSLAKLQQDIPREFFWRVQEMMCRWHTDAGHWFRLCDIACRAPSGQFCLYLAVLSQVRNFLSTFKDLRNFSILWYESGVVSDQPQLQWSPLSRNTCGIYTIPDADRDPLQTAWCQHSLLLLVEDR